MPTYAVEQRLRFIDFLLHEYGYFNRSAIMNYFGISQPQASLDIKQYLTLVPDNVRYDTKLKAYFRSESFKRW